MHKKLTALVVSTGLAGAIAGGVLMSNVSANAAGDTSSAGTSYAAPRAGADHGNGAGTTTGDPTKPMRDDEQLLTGTTLAKVTAAVRAKYPDATIQRVETDSDGVYEAHIVDNGTPVTVELGRSFAITGTESGPGDRPGGQAPAA